LPPSPSVPSLSEKRNSLLAPRKFVIRVAVGDQNGARSTVGGAISNGSLCKVPPLLIAFHILIQAGFVVRVLLRAHGDPASRIAWIVVILALPVVGIVDFITCTEGEETGYGFAYNPSYKPCDFCF
jgi:Phospholipase_D-nuclease N-terminal